MQPEERQKSADIESRNICKDLNLRHLKRSLSKCKPPFQLCAGGISVEGITNSHGLLIDIPRLVVPAQVPRGEQIWLYSSVHWADTRPEL